MILEHNSFKESFGTLESKEIYRIGNDLYFGSDRVNPEFAHLITLPFINHTTIRFTSTILQRENSEKQRYDILKKLIYPINRKIKNKFPDISTGNKTFRFCWVNEYGQSEEDVHLHILGFVHPDTPHEVKMKIYQFLKYLSRKEINGIESIHTTTVRKRAGIVSYFCKIENKMKKDTFKKINYSIGSYSMIKEFYPSYLISKLFDNNSSLNAKIVS